MEYVEIASRLRSLVSALE